MGMVKTRIGERIETYKLEILSPVHIGTGNKLTKMDFIVDDNSLSVLNMDEVFNFLSRKGLVNDRFLEDLSRGRLSLKGYFPRRKPPEYLLKYEADVVTAQSNTESVSNINEVWEATKYIDNTGVTLYIPASELKGYIRTAIVYMYIKDNWDRFESKFENIGRNFKFKEWVEESMIFGKATDDPMKYFKIEDIYGDFAPKVFGIRLLFSPSKNGLIDYAECIATNSVSCGFNLTVW